MKTNKLNIVIALLASMLFFQCQSDEQEEKLELTQEKLNNSTVHVEDFTGQAFEVSIPHGGPPENTVDSTIRAVYSNVNKLGASIEKGTIITKRTYKKNPDGTKGTLYVVYAMFKRESGYDSENGNWEYVSMPASEDIDYTANPNGVLSAAGTERGKLNGCISCHAAAEGDDHVFAND